MNIEKLEVGMTLKYKELCELLGVEAKSSKNTNGRKSQSNEFKRYFDYEKQGQKFIITKIHDTAKEKNNNYGGNNRVFVDDFRNLMIYMLHENRTECMLMSKGAMFKAMNLVNENYLLARNNIPKLSEIISVPQSAIYEFYDYNSGKLRDTLERNLKHCRSRSLLMFESVVSVAINEVHIVSNELNTPVLSPDGIVLSNNELVYREATKQERQLILRYENEVKAELGFTDNKEIFVRGKWKYFKTEVEKRLINAGTNIKFYYESYRITWNNKKIDEEFEKLKDLNKEILEANLNSNMIKSINKSSVNRHNKASDKLEKEDNKYKRERLLRQNNSDYVSEQEQLTFNLINKDATVFKSKIKEPIDRKKFNKINNISDENINNDDKQMEIDFCIDDGEIPF